jgi:hypothetical protein
MRCSSFPTQSHHYVSSSPISSTARATKLDKIGQPSRFPGFGIANFSLLAGKTSLVIVNKLGFVLNKWLVLPRLSNFVQFHWSPLRPLPRSNPSPASASRRKREALACQIEFSRVTVFSG